MTTAVQRQFTNQNEYPQHKIGNSLFSSIQLHRIPYQYEHQSKQRIKRKNKSNSSKRGRGQNGRSDERMLRVEGVGGAQPRIEPLVGAHVIRVYKNGRSSILFAVASALNVAGDDSDDDDEIAHLDCRWRRRAWK